MSMQDGERRYRHTGVESKWQKEWEKASVYSVSDDDSKPKWYELTMYPYPSGDIHIGHWYAMAPSDAHARFMRMKGYNVLHPMGFDAFGLPAENAAIKNGIHPFKYTMANIDNMRLQLKAMGTMYDWDREIVTCSPEYYKWNQWMFLQLYNSDLAYQTFAPANWCPSCNTVLANEQVIEGVCERCQTDVTHRDLNQWFFRITEYADELLDHSNIEWPEKINSMQANWIGRSEGVEVDFDISGKLLNSKTLSTFTTRVDTIYGVTFVVLAPEHPLVSELTLQKHKLEVEAYIEQARRQTEVQRLSTEKEKTGVFTGSYCRNILTDEDVPIFVGDYVLPSYGTGMVMGVPAHDQRDFEFAKKYGILIKVVIAEKESIQQDISEAYVVDGILVNSGQFNGTTSSEARNQIANHMESLGFGRKHVNYRVRDWLISRQRYWGTPIPIIYCNECGTVPVPENDLPVLLPEDAEFRPTGESPLALHAGFVNTSCPLCGSPANRETDTMDTFVDSSWYQLRFTSPNYRSGAFDPSVADQWGPVDQYTGGAEHAVMHLLYSRFFTKALRDMDLVKFDEPFIRLFSQGHIIAGSQKMSKSRGNVVAPDNYVEKFGADTVRCYLMFLGPWDQGGEWSDNGINGMYRWLNRIWDICTRDSTSRVAESIDTNRVREYQRFLHKTIKRVTEDMDRFKFNTSIAGMMELSNFINQNWDNWGIGKEIWDESVEVFIKLLAPMAPHLSEELWFLTGHEFSIHQQPWPEWSGELATDELITLIIQVNGRLRDKIDVESSISQEEAEKIALGRDRVKAHISGNNIQRVIYIDGKLINIVAS